MNTAVAPHHHSTGWRPDPPDVRDHYYHLSPHAKEDETAIKAEVARTDEEPVHVDLSDLPYNGAILDQGDLGSCTSFGSLRIYDFEHHKQFLKFLAPSHLFQYYNSRYLEGNMATDSGATVRDALKALAKFGAVPEKSMPYVTKNFAHKPTIHEFNVAKKNLVLEYLRVENDIAKSGLGNLRVCLAAGYPIVFGCTLYASFEEQATATTGLVSMPRPTEAVLGGHCMVIVGYDDTKQLFKVANSWGTGFGAHGYVWMPYEYLTNPDLATDFWTVRKVA